MNLTKKRADGGVVEEGVGIPVERFDDETEAYMNGEMSWQDYLFKRSITQTQPSSATYSPMTRVQNSSDNRQLRLKNGLENSPLSSYLLFGKAPEAPKQWSHPFLEKLASSVCEKNPLTKFANALAKLRMLSFVEMEMNGCGFRATARWLKAMKLNVAHLQRPCTPSYCCNRSEMINEQMLCDGGNVAIPTCDEKICKWKYDCANAISLDDDTNTTNTTNTNNTIVRATPRSTYWRTYGAQASNGVEYVDDTTTVETSNGLSRNARIGLGVGVGVGGVAVVAILSVVGYNMWKKRQPQEKI